MIVVIPQLICCFISTKTEIPHDYGAPRERKCRGEPARAVSLGISPATRWAIHLRPDGRA
jgi:hypothetical protein